MPEEAESRFPLLKEVRKRQRAFSQASPTEAQGPEGEAVADQPWQGVRFDPEE